MAKTSGDVFSFGLEGADLFRAAMQAIPQVVRKELAGAVGEAADMVRSRAASGAPRASVTRRGRSSGDLPRNVIVVGRATSLTRRVGIRDIDLASRGSRNTFHRNPGVYGIKAVEFPMKRRRGWGSYHPFLRPALQGASGWFVSALLRRGPAIEAALVAYNRGSAGG